MFVLLAVYFSFVYRRVCHCIIIAYYFPFLDVNFYTGYNLLFTLFLLLIVITVVLVCTGTSFASTGDALQALCFVFA